MFDFLKLIDLLLLPEYCIVCNKKGRILCKNCYSYLPVKYNNYCPYCERVETYVGNVCPSCKRNGKNFLNGVVVCSYYQHPVVKEMLHLLKFRSVKSFSSPLAMLMDKKIKESKGFSIKDYVLCNVPLHPKKLLSRGFNQSELLGRKLAKLQKTRNKNLEFLPRLLLKTKNTSPQSKLNIYGERRRNIKGAFKINHEYKENKLKKIIVIDDVMTTGATLDECARVLKRAGAKKVWGLVVARQRI